MRGALLLGLCSTVLSCSGDEVAGQSHELRDAGSEVGQGGSHAGGSATGGAAHAGAASGTGGVAATGGTLASGGTPNTGGAAGSPDGSADGGVAGGSGGLTSDAAPNAGGTPSTGGMTSSDGSANTGGVPGNGGASSADASVTDTGAPTVKDASADGGPSARDASTDAHYGRESGAGACTYPSLGVMRLGTTNAMYVLARLGAIEDELIQLAQEAKSSFVGQRELETGEVVTIAANFTLDRSSTTSPNLCIGRSQTWKLSPLAGAPPISVTDQQGRIVDITLQSITYVDASRATYSSVANPCKTIDTFTKTTTVNYTLTDHTTGESLIVSTQIPIELTTSTSVGAPPYPFVSGKETVQDAEGHDMVVNYGNGTATILGDVAFIGYPRITPPVPWSCGPDNCPLPTCYDAGSDGAAAADASAPD